eukprot:2195829-Alexandrium_andersonii.AAC.1
MCIRDSSGLCTCRRLACVHCGCAGARPRLTGRSVPSSVRAPRQVMRRGEAVSYTHLRAHETSAHL